jgi:hypothetical protein
MLLYIGSEFSRAIRSREFKKYTLVILIVSVLANLSIIAFRDYVYGTNDGTYGYNIIMFAGGFFWLPYYATIFVAEMLFGKTYPDPYIKDRVTKNLRRRHIYIGKTLAALLMLAVFAVLTFVIFIVTSTVFQLSTGSLSADVVKDFGVNVLCAVPLLMVGVSIGMMMLFCFENRVWALLAFWAVTIVIPRIIMLLGAEPISIDFFRFIKDEILITPQFTTLQFFASRDVKQIIISSAIYIAISSFIGLMAFRGKQIDNVPVAVGREMDRKKRK